MRIKITWKNTHPHDPWLKRIHNLKSSVISTKHLYKIYMEIQINISLLLFCYTQTSFQMLVPCTGMSKYFSAHFTSIQFVTSMRSQMLSQVTLPTKHLTTNIAFMLFNTSVGQLVFFQITVFSKGFPTHSTGEWFVPCMCAGMFCESVFLCTFILTLITGIWTFPRMSSHMSI